MNINAEFQPALMSPPAKSAAAPAGNPARPAPADRHPNRLKRGGSVLLAAVIAAGLPAAVASPAEATAVTKCSSRDWRCDQSGYAEHAHRSFWLMYSGHNCTNYVAYRLIRDGASPKIGYLHNGGDWASDARRHHIPVNDQPVVGAVAQWNPGAGGMSSSGHVAYVEKVGDGWILIAEDNYSSGPMNLRQIHVGDPEWPSNFIHFPRRTLGPAPEAQIPVADGTVAGPNATGFDLSALFRAAAPTLATG